MATAAKGLFIVRAEVRDPADRAGLDAWYEKEHLPDALEAFGAARAWRAWSRIDPAVHYAYYEFPTLEAALAIPASEALKPMVAEFDRAWGTRVTRTREIVEVVQALPG